MTDTYPIHVLTRPSTFEVDMPWQDVTFATLEDAIDCLDSLEHQKVEEHEFVIVGGQFHVRWR